MRIIKNLNVVTLVAAVGAAASGPARAAVVGFDLVAASSALQGSGVDAPGTSTGTYLLSFDSPMLAAGGQVTFRATLAGAGVVTGGSSNN